MDYKKQLIEKIESFYIDVIEEFKEAELRIMADSKFRSIFKKKDYDGHIDTLRAFKKQVLAIESDSRSIPEDDTEAHEVVRRFERCLVIFAKLCDDYVQMQLLLKKKSEKEPVKFSQYNDMFKKVNETRASLNDALHELDIVYTDYTYDENEEPYEFLK